MAGAENVDHAARENGFREPIRGFANGGLLGGNSVNEATALGKVFGGGCGGCVVHTMAMGRSTKHQDPSSKEAPNSKTQIPKKSQDTNSGLKLF
jgi:hypothetical protein